jgi:RNA polymerase sigma-70 factor (ECF subfamily)
MTLIASCAVAVTAQLDLSDLEPFRRELTGYCYRMLGSGFEAEDAVQETMIKALRGSSGFEGRSSVRSWLYRIATNVCIDMSRQVQRRARPMDFGPASPPDESLLGPIRPELPWVSPIADGKVLDPAADPAEVAVQRDSIRLAFVTALQHLPARQRAALVLCEVLSWPAADAAELLDTTVAAVNSSLQRARATLAQLPAGSESRPMDTETAELVQRYVDAFERYDMDDLVKLLHDDAVQSMPPFELWVQGAGNITAWMLQPSPSACRGSKLIPLGQVNGCPAFAQYKPDPAGGLQPWGIQLLEISEGKIAELAIFLAPMDPERLFPSFGLPLHLDS